jgi:hypothetical protein
MADAGGPHPDPLRPAEREDDAGRWMGGRRAAVHFSAPDLVGAIPLRLRFESELAAARFGGVCGYG